MTGLLLLVVLSAQVERPAVAGAVGSGVSEPDRVAIFKAAGAEPRKGKWVICDPPADVGAPASEAMIEQVADLNGDGRLEAIVVDGGTYCYGHAGAGFILLSKQADGGWRVITRQNGMLAVLKTKGAGAGRIFPSVGRGSAFRCIAGTARAMP